MDGIDRTTLCRARDVAFILVGYDGALRIGELAALALDELESRPDGIALRIRRSKTDRTGWHPNTLGRLFVSPRALRMQLFATVGARRHEGSEWARFDSQAPSVAC